MKQFTEGQVIYVKAIVTKVGSHGRVKAAKIGDTNIHVSQYEIIESTTAPAGEVAALDQETTPILDFQETTPILD